MKTIVLVFLFSIFSLVSLSQQITTRNFGGAASDTLIADTTYNSPVFSTGYKVPCLAEWVIKIDSVSGTPEYTIGLRGSLNGVEYYSFDEYRDTIADFGTEDKYFYWNVSDPTMMKYWRFQIITTATAQKISYKGSVSFIQSTYY